MEATAPVVDRLQTELMPALRAVVLGHRSGSGDSRAKRVFGMDKDKEYLVMRTVTCGISHAFLCLHMPRMSSLCLDP